MLLCDLFGVAPPCPADRAGVPARAVCIFQQAEQVWLHQLMEWGRCESVEKLIEMVRPEDDHV